MRNLWLLEKSCLRNIEYGSYVQIPLREWRILLHELQMIYEWTLRLDSCLKLILELVFSGLLLLRLVFPFVVYYNWISIFLISWGSSFKLFLFYLSVIWFGFSQYLLTYLLKHLSNTNEIQCFIKNLK